MGKDEMLRSITAIRATADSVKGPHGIDARYPAIPNRTGWFLGSYPLAIGVAVVFGIHISQEMWGLLALAGVWWGSVLFAVVKTIYRREGYNAAMDDFALLRMAEDGLAGKLPAGLQAEFNVTVEKVKAKP